MTRLRVAIVGAGIGGLAAANALTRHGVSVTVYERAAELGEVGAGIGLSPNAVRLLDRLGLGERLRAVSTPLRALTLRRWSGETIVDSRIEESETTLAIYRPDAIDVLRSGLSGHAAQVELHTGRRCVTVSQDDACASVTFADGETVPFDAVIGADGIHSAVRPAVVKASAAVFSGSVAYRGVLPAERLPAGPVDVGRGWAGPGRHFLVFPPFHGGRLINWVGIVPGEPDAGESWSAPGDPAALAAAFAGWDDAVGEVIAAVDTTFVWGLYDRDPLPRWTRDRLTLLGDAAHPMLPHIGQGANQAIEDGVALAVLLAGVDTADVPRALRDYEGLRRPRTTPIQQAGRTNGQLLDGAQGFGGALAGVFDDMRTLYDYDVEAAAVAVRAGSR